MGWAREGGPERHFRLLACSCPAVTTSQCLVMIASVTSQSRSGSRPAMPPSGLKGMAEVSLLTPVCSIIVMHCSVKCTASRHLDSAMGPDLQG